MTDKYWRRTGESNYSFFIDDKEAGQLSIKLNTMESRAIAQVRESAYHMRRTGFWKNNIEVSDHSGKIIMKVFNKKWYGSSAILQYKEKEYQLVIRNNPMAEWAILDNEKVFLAYGLTSDNKSVKIKITTAAVTEDLLPDFLLWYLFAPIAQENTGGNFVFQVLAAQ